MAEFDNSSSTEANASEIEGFIDEKFGEIIAANTEKKNHIVIEKYAKACQVNFDKINIEACYRSGCQALQNEKMVKEIKSLREQINEKKLIFVETINREEDIERTCLKVVLMMKSPCVNVSMVQ